MTTISEEIKLSYTDLTERETIVLNARYLVLCSREVDWNAPKDVMKDIEENIRLKIKRFIFESMIEEIMSNPPVGECMGMKIYTDPAIPNGVMIIHPEQAFKLMEVKEPWR